LGLKNSTFFLILFLPFTVFGYSIDSLNLEKDTLALKMPKQVHFGSNTNKIATFVAPAIFVGYGFTALHNNLLKKVDHSVYEDMNEDHPGFSWPADNYLQYAPAAAAFAFKMAGIKSKNQFINQIVLYSISTGIMSSAVTFFKHNTNKFRPNGSSFTSFPSGHTATAFVAAEFLYQEYGDKSVWYGVGGYTIATATGILRVYNNAHWFSDIIAGAGFGILSVKAAYALYPELKKLFPNKNHLQFQTIPSYQNGIMGISLNGKF
jgi:membrane-associated phospholipid phosphatase